MVFARVRAPTTATKPNARIGARDTTTAGRFIDRDPAVEAVAYVLGDLSRTAEPPIVS
jgi:hypothetical protein